MNKRIIGIDVARALAVIGMIIVNFKVVFGDNGSSWLKTAAQLFDGKAAATFVVLAGIGLALMTNRAVRDDDWAKMKTARKRIIKRSLFLFVIGLSYLWIWPADILHFYGVYMLLTLLFIHRPGQQILVATAALILLFPILLLFFDYEAGWDFSTLTYSGFWTFSGFFRNLLFNGFHPVIPWAAFMLFGLWYGRQDLRDDRFLKKSLRLSLTVFATVQLLSIGLIKGLSGNNPATAEELSIIFGTDPMPPMPLYMLNGLSISTLIISACILIAKRHESSTIIKVLNQTGQLALTFYVAHVVIGMGAVEAIGSKQLGAYSIAFSVLYALVFSLLCVGFANWWLKDDKMGPLEWVMRKLTG
jgi:uncharacterized membrane protein YeiB